MSMSAHEAGKTYDCKFPGCTAEARSPVGRYSYCADHQGQGQAAAKPRALRAAGGSESGTEGALRDLLALAKDVDKAKAKAEKLQGRANAALREAAGMQRQYREALAAAARGDVST